MSKKNLLENYKLVLGLEIHLHLKTETKMFCRCSADIYESDPNTHTCPVCLGLPGALPIPNKNAVRKAQLLGLALNCRLNKNSRFDRKHYIYPDLPKGYQISQYDLPLCEMGQLMLSSGEKVDITRVHLEEDTAKSIHNKNETLLDFNKSGMPLVEIVTEPTFKNVSDAVEFSKKIQDIVRTLGIGDGDMEKGQMRLEANISLRSARMEREGKLPSYKVEIKNINSFKFMEKAVKAEIKRQANLFSTGEMPVQENRGYDEINNVTVLQRGKEEAHDYRYFPEPDIPPMSFTDKVIEELKSIMPELPYQIEQRLIEQYGLDGLNAKFLSSGYGLDLLEKFENLCSFNLDPSKVANLLKNRPNYRKMSNDEIIEKINIKKLRISTKDDLVEPVSFVLKNNMNALRDYKDGNENVIEFLLGQVMRKTKGKGDPKVVREMLKESLGGK